jgi:hypothetical protein
LPSQNNPKITVAKPKALWDINSKARHKPTRRERKEHTMKAEIKNGKLIIETDINPTPTPSATGKTLVVASSHGNQPTTATVNGKPVIVGLNAYIRR